MSIPTIACGVSRMPVVGFGSWQCKPGVVGAAIEHALLNGYRHIDCAPAYENEEEVGEAFTRVFKSGKVSREEVFVTSKLWNTYHRAEDVPTACAKTLADLKLNYLDLFIIHWPVCMEPHTGQGLFPVDGNGETMMDSKSPSFAETWGALEKLVDEGKCKNIGLSNFNIKQIEEVLKVARVKPACLQVESHPQLPNLELLEFCNKHGISFVAYSPLGNPGSVYRREDQVDLLHDEDVKEIAAKHGATVGQVLIRYQVDKGNATIPKSVRPARIDENLDVFGFKLDEEDMKTLNNNYLKYGPKGYRTCPCTGWGKSPFYPFQDEL